MPFTPHDQKDEDEKNIDMDQVRQGMNALCGVKGGRLSGGQKQRVAIARAVIRDPKILLLDEATSALDAKNERVIMENLNQFFEDRTAIVIAHRLSTVKNADQIIVLDEGKIVEAGTHTELIERAGYYQDIYNQQLEEKLTNH